MKRLLLLLVLLLSVALPAWPESDDLELKTSMAIVLLRLGNYPECQRLTRELVEQGAQAEGLELLTGELALEPLMSLSGQGQYLRLLREAPAFIERARIAGRPDREAQYRLLVLHAAYLSGHPQQFLDQLGPLRVLTERPVTTAEKMRRFTVLVFQNQYAHLQTPPGPEGWRRDHDEAWSLLRDIRLDQDYRRNSLVEKELAAAACLASWEQAFRTLPYDQARQAMDRDTQALAPFFDDSGFLQRRSQRARAAELLREDPTSDIVCFSRAMFSVFDMVSLEYGRQTATTFVEENLSRIFRFLEQFEEEPTFGWLDPRLARYEAVSGNVARLASTAWRIEAVLSYWSGAAATEVDSDLGQAALFAARSGDRLMVDIVDLLRMNLWMLREPVPPGLEAELRGLIARSVQTGSHYAEMTAWYTLGLFQYAQRKDPACLPALARAIAIFEDLYTQARLGASSRSLLRLYRSLYEDKARIELELGLQREAAETLDRLKQVGTALAFQTLQPRDPRSQAALQRANQAKDQAEELRQSLAVAPETERPRIARQLARTRQEFYVALAEIGRLEPGYRRLQVRPNTFSQVQARLPDDTLLVQLFPSENRLYLFLATRHELRIRVMDVSSQQIDRWVADFRRSALRPSREWLQDKALCQTMQSMSQALLLPLESDLAGKKVVAFVPTGTLCYLPMAALAHWREGEPTFLLESAQVVTLMKASDLDLPSMSLPGKLSLLALGDPDGSLPGARREVTALQSLVPGAEVFVGREATAERLQSSKARYLHLATHGMLNSQNPTASFLLLAPGEKQGSERLLVSDIAGLRLENVSMVTLSACQTALAERSPEPGADLQSLADAFGFAGSPSVVASLWKVEDEPTCQLMLKMYEALARGQPKGEALRQAQLALLRQKETSHPYFWAGFIFLGDWR